MTHRGLFWYVTLVAALVVVLQLYAMHVQRAIRRTDYQACVRAEALASNQAELIKSTLALVEQPQFRALGVPQDQFEWLFRYRLRQVPAYDCGEAP